MRKRKIMIISCAVCFLAVFLSTDVNAALVDNGDGTVTNDVTGLMWQQKDDNTPRTWDAAVAYCEALSLSTYTDWRIPTLRELRTLVDKSKYNPSIDSTFFPKTNSSAYWTSDTPGGNKLFRWNVEFYGGDDKATDKSEYNYSRCVRSP